MKLDAVVVLLASASGWLDGTAYLRAHVFIANMTGNTVLLGLGLGHHPPEAVLKPMVALAAFAGGAFAGTALAEDRRGSVPRSGSRVLQIEIVILAAFALLWLSFSRYPVPIVLLVALAAFGMGLQQAATDCIHPKPAISTTYQGGTVERIGAGLHQALRGSPTGLALNASIWVVYLGAAVGVALLGKVEPSILGFIPLAVVAAAFAAFAVTVRRQGTKE